MNGRPKSMTSKVWMCYDFNMEVENFWDSYNTKFITNEIPQLKTEMIG